MDGIKTVDDLIRAKNLTAEEMTQFEDLIEEFKERERKIKENVSTARSNLNQLLFTIATLGEKTSVLGKALNSLLEEIDIAKLKLMPNDKFYRE
jgi:hypothetical protein